MTQQNQDSSSEKIGSSGFAHWGRVALMILSFGMIYPNAMIENLDVAKYDAENKARGN